MKIPQLIDRGVPSLSFEVFPPKVESRFSSVRSAVEEIARLRPAFMSVTFGAGGGTSRYTLEIAQNIQALYGVPSLFHEQTRRRRKDPEQSFGHSGPVTPAGLWACTAPPPVCRQEILRYAGAAAGGKSPDPATLDLLESCLEEAWDKLTYQVCWRTLQISIDGDRCSLGLFQTESRDLARNLRGCTQAVLLAATVGVGIDRLIARYGRISPARSLMFQVIGTERVEALCYLFCSRLSAGTGLAQRPRFSPGYGDLPLALQSDIIRALDCPRKIGLCLNQSLLMSPSKSVTALVGLGGSAGDAPVPQSKCAGCAKINCTFREKP